MEGQHNAENAIEILNRLNAQFQQPQENEEVSPFTQWVADLSQVDVGLTTLQATTEALASSTAQTLGNALNPFIASQDKIATNFRQISSIIGKQVVSALIQAIVKATILKALTSFLPGVGSFLGLAGAATGSSGAAGVTSAVSTVQSVASPASSAGGLGKTTNVTNTTSFGDINVNGVADGNQLEDTIKFSLLPKINELVEGGERLNSSRLI